MSWTNYAAHAVGLALITLQCSKYEICSAEDEENLEEMSQAQGKTSFSHVQEYRKQLLQRRTEKLFSESLFQFSDEKPFLDIHY